VVFVDHDALAIRTVRQNLMVTRLSDRAQVIHSDAFRFLTRRPAERFEIIYVAPPQYAGLWVRSLEALDETPGWLSGEGQVVVQIDPREYRPIAAKNLQEIEQRRYGSTLLCFFGRREAG
jgi:16S rRNA G966 N2-methylase RsmD